MPFATRRPASVGAVADSQMPRTTFRIIGILNLPLAQSAAATSSETATGRVLAH
jgi:hypothetical protein